LIGARSPRFQARTIAVTLSRRPFALHRQPSLGLLFGASLAGYLLVSRWFPLRPYHDQFPLQDIRSLAPSPNQAVAYACLLLVLFACYGLAYRRIGGIPAQQQPLFLFVLPLLFSLPLIFTYPYNATDLYRYYLGGRISAVYGQSPLSVPPGAFAGDPLMALAGEWIDESSPYGPVWEAVAAVLVWAGSDNLFLGMVLLKAFTAAIHLGIGLLIWQLLAKQKTATRTARTLLWTWNPALWLIFVANGHNDVLMLFWLLLGVWLQQRGRPAAGLIVMTLSPLSKAIGLLPLPFLWLATWRSLPGLRERLQTFSLAAGGSLLLAAVTFWPFGSPLTLLLRLQAEAGQGGGFSPLVLLILMGRRLGWPVAIQPLTTAATLLFVAAALWLLWLAARDRAPWRGVAGIFALYLAQALRFRIWYTAWLLPWLLLDTGPAGEDKLGFRLRAGLIFLLTGQLSPLIYGHVRVFLMGGDQVMAHLLGVPFTFVLPLLVAWAANRYSATGRESR
jgi:alpha-1,6-mannosyltransferase